jgi:hypothetical protein
MDCAIAVLEMGLRPLGVVAESCNANGIHQGPRLQLHSFDQQQGIDGGKDLLGQLVDIQQSNRRGVLPKHRTFDSPGAY